MATPREKAERRRTDIRLRVLACNNIVREVGRGSITIVWDSREQVPCLEVMNRIHLTWLAFGEPFNAP